MARSNRGLVRVNVLGKSQPTQPRIGAAGRLITGKNSERNIAILALGSLDKVKIIEDFTATTSQQECPGDLPRIQSGPGILRTISAAINGDHKMAGISPFAQGGVKRFFKSAF